MSAAGYKMDAKIELAALAVLLKVAERRDDGLDVVMGAVTQHPAARIASAVDDVVIAGLTACPGCGAEPQEPCHWDCSAHWHDPEGGI